MERVLLVNILTEVIKKRVEKKMAKYDEFGRPIYETAEEYNKAHRTESSTYTYDSPEGDAYNHSMIVMDKVAEITDDIKVRWAALLHDLGKGITPKEILPHHYQHDINGVEVVRNLCNRLKLPKEWTKLAVAVAKEHMRAGLYDNMKIPKKVAFLEKNYKYLNELELIAQVDSKKSNLQFAEIGKKMIEQVNGNIFTLPNNETAKEILHNKRIEWFKREDA